jgi:diacylglycerol kinase (ATP)
MVVAGEHVGQPEIVYRQGHEVVIERSDGAPLLFELDGDLWTGAEERLTLSMVPGALPVHCPAKAVAG